MRTRLVPVFLLGFLVFGCSAAGGGEEQDARAGAAWPSDVTVVRRGAPGDVDPALDGPSLLLQGSGPPLVSAFKAHLDRLAQAPLDVVVLAASSPSGSSPTPECDVLARLAGVHACWTITIPDPQGADADTVATMVRQAEAVYFAGGNQCNYVPWAGTAVHAAVEEVVERGGGVGGGSAGLAIQGEVAYDGCAGSVRSEEALSNPYHPSISFTERFFTWAALDHVITDSHFAERDRMGRLMAFVARQMEGAHDAFYGLGVNEGAAVVVDAEGRGTVYGGFVYVVRGDHTPEQSRRGTPLTYSGIDIVRLSEGARYDFRSRPFTAAYERSVEAGSLSANPYAPR
jgi:cyanophycinase-like exopeptidase